MKTKVILIVMLLVASVTARAEFVSARVGVDGLTCSMCARGVEETLKQLEFIDSIHVDLNKLVATIVFKKGSNVEIEKIHEMIEDAGFSIRSLDAIFSFHDEAVSKDSHFAFGGNTYHFIGAKEQTLNGNVQLRFIDKQYINKREFKEFLKKTTFECYQKGKTSSCCKVEGNLYHIMIAA
jgi:copper chaperone CopZ